MILAVFATLLVMSLVDAPGDEASRAAPAEDLMVQYAEIAAENARLHEEIERLLEPGLPALALESCELTSADPGLPGWVDPLQEHGRSVDQVLTQEMNEATCTG